MLYKLSPSTLNLFVECPRCFYNQIVKREKRPDTPFPSLPSGMDRILKEHFDRFMDGDELPPELRVDECNGLKLFGDREKLKVWRNNRKGIEYLDESLDILLHGAIDNLLTNGKKLIVLDYKTRGFQLKEDTHKHYITQLDIYNYLLRKNGFQTESYSYLLFYYPKEVLSTGEVIFNTSLIKIKTDPARGEKVFKDATKLLLGKKEPESSENCEFCKYRKN